jgi:hypothetical protein
MTLAIDEFIRRSSSMCCQRLPPHQHYGLLAKPSCADNIARARQLLAMPQDERLNGAYFDMLTPSSRFLVAGMLLTTKADRAKLCLFQIRRVEALGKPQ